MPSGSSRRPWGKRPTGALTSRLGPWASHGLPSHSNIRSECRPGEFAPWCTGSSRPAGGFLCGAEKGPCPKGILPCGRKESSIRRAALGQGGLPVLCCHSHLILLLVKWGGGGGNSNKAA